jgi:hypothetical protein
MEINSSILKERLPAITVGASGVIGTAATTVDIVSNIGVAASAINLVLTLPTPTDSRSGLSTTVMNTGANAFTMYGVLVKPTEYAEFMWGNEGDGWHSEAVQVPVSAQLLAVASGYVDLGDPVPVGARPFVSYFNVSSATGIDGSVSDARLSVNFTVPATTANYTISGALRSKVAANWNNDNDTTWQVVSQSTTGFVIAIKEYVSIAQGLFFDFTVHTTAATPALLPTQLEVVALVPLNTAVSIDNLQMEARLTGGQGFRLSSVAGTFQYNISAVTSYAADAVFGSNRPTLTATTAMAHPFAWTGQSDADAMTGMIYDRTNGRVYEFCIQTNVAPVLSYIRITRKI